MNRIRKVVLLVLIGYNLVLIGCNQNRCTKSKTTLNQDSVASNRCFEIGLQNLVDSLKYDYDGNNADHESHIQKKIVARGKPILPFLLKKLDDTTKSSKLMNVYDLNTTVGDNARSYIYDIYCNTAWEKHRHLDSLNKYFLNPTEEEILLKIMPEVKKYQNSANVNLYWIYMYNTENKMSKQERRKRYKEEFLKALNRDLFKTK